jgi:hypothetical protein
MFPNLTAPAGAPQDVLEPEELEDVYTPVSTCAHRHTSSDKLMDYNFYISINNILTLHGENPIASLKDPILVLRRYQQPLPLISEELLGTAVGSQSSYFFGDH